MNLFGLKQTFLSFVLSFFFFRVYAGEDMPVHCHRQPDSLFYFWCAHTALLPLVAQGLQANPAFYLGVTSFFVTLSVRFFPLAPCLTTHSTQNFFFFFFSPLYTFTHPLVAEVVSLVQSLRKNVTARQRQSAFFIVKWVSSQVSL